jgi:hypothetical protein
MNNYPLGEAEFFVGWRRRAGVTAILADPVLERLRVAETMPFVRAVDEVVEDMMWAAPWMKAAEPVHIRLGVQISFCWVGQKHVESEGTAGVN